MASIKRVAVLGSGVMGSAIAAHMANANIDTYLLDIVPERSANGTRAARSSEDADADRNRLARTGLEAALRAAPPAFFVPENARLITVGNLEDDLACLRDTDWVIECVVEDMEIKKQLLRRIDAFLRPGTIITTNTSALSINVLAQALSPEHRESFMGTHFFNPPRYMKLLEIIPASATSREAIHFLSGFCERRLGKGIVFARDTPNFAANRIGTHNVVAVIKTMLEQGLTIEEVDAITGSPLGRPRSATFRTLDMVGLDTFVHVCGYVANSLTDPVEKDGFTLPAFVLRMVNEDLVGDKTGQGFYKKVKTAEGSETLALDIAVFEHVPQRPVDLPILKQLKAIKDPGERVRALVYSDDRAGRFAWSVVKKLLLYSASKVSEIVDDIVNLDRAVKWGYNHELGPFELWDAIGVRESVGRMATENEKIPDNVKRMLDLGKDTFYRSRYGKRHFYDFEAAGYKRVEIGPDVVILPSNKDRRRLIRGNAGASLIDIGEGVACLELHSPDNTLGIDILDMIDYCIDEVAANWEGLVIASRGKNFCVGGNLKLVLMEAQNSNWQELDAMVRLLQDAGRKIKFSERPVVAAPYQRALGAGCEVCLASSRVRAFAESYMGLVEMGIGLVPPGGGCKEMLLRSIDCVPAAVPALMAGSGQPGLMPYVSRVFETIAMARVSTSAWDAQKIGYLKPEDRISLNQDHLLHDARETVLSLAREGYQPPRPRDDIRVTGKTGFAAIDASIYYLKEGQFISEHDALVSRKIASILTGGDLPENTLVTEDYLLDLERESFLSLCGEAKTQARILAMLTTGRPLRN